MRQFLCDFCGKVIEFPSLFQMARPEKDYVHTQSFDMCPTCENIVVPASDIFIREVKKQCQKADRESRDL